MPPGSSRTYRPLLSAFFVLHFGSVLAYVAPFGSGVLARAAGAPGLRVEVVAARAVARAAPITSGWLDMTAARQHWALFAPDPVRWTPALEVVAWYAPHEGASAAWHADSILLAGPSQRPYPHLVDRRAERVQFWLGYETVGPLYRPFYAAYLCRTLADPLGRAPAGLELEVVWSRVPLPWEGRGEDGELVRQSIGGYTCGG